VVNVSRDSDGTGILNLNLHPRSRVTFINVSIVLKNCYAFSNFMRLFITPSLTTFILSFQEHPTTVFSKVIGSEKQILPRIFYKLRTAKSF